MTDFDVIIIGAGHNGLICALYLARAGFRVIVLEQAGEIGGASRSSEVTLPGFTHDLFASNFTLFAASRAYADFKADLDVLGVRFLSNDCPYATGYPNGEAVRVFTDEALTEAEIARVSPNDTENWKGAVAFFKTAAPSLLHLHSTTMPSWSALQQVARIAFRKPSINIELARLLVDSSRQFLDRHFSSADVKGLLAPWGFHLDYGSNVRGGAGFSFISAMSTHLRGIKIVEGGASQLMSALRLLIENSSGRVRTNCNVTGINVAENRAVSVKLNDGETLTASRAIIASVTPGRLFSSLIDPDVLPSSFYSRIKQFRHGVGTFVVHLALNSALEWNAGSNLADFNYLHLFGSLPEIEKSYAEACHGLLPERPMLIVSQTTAVDPLRAPAGHHVVRVHARAFPALIQGDAAGRLNGRDWHSVREAVADRIIDMLAEHAPNVRSALLARYIMSPADLELENPNLVGGDCNGGSHHLRQYYFARPILGWSRYETPVQNLYMIGASQWPGSGINGTSGRLLAERLITRLR